MSIFSSDIVENCIADEVVRERTVLAACAILQAIVPLLNRALYGPLTWKASHGGSRRIHKEFLDSAGLGIEAIIYYL